MRVLKGRGGLLQSARGGLFNSARTPARRKRKLVLVAKGGEDIPVSHLLRGAFQSEEGKRKGDGKKGATKLHERKGSHHREERSMKGASNTLA